MSIKFHFFGKDCVIDRKLANRTNLERVLVRENIYPRTNLFLNQIHGNEVVVIDSPEKIYGNQDLPKADALVTNIPNIALCVITADCAPVLLFDSKKNIVAAAHAGWRGAKSNVVLSVVKRMHELGAQDIEVVIGPMIQQESYEVSAEFFADFLNENPANKFFFVAAAKQDKYLFDLPSYVEKKLREAGVKKITNSRIDTYKNDERFFSFRRSAHRGEVDCGRNVSVIVCE